MYSLNLLAIALELAQEDAAYEDMASKFWEHFVYIAHAMNHRGGEEEGLWDEADGFFYDVLHCPGGGHIPLKVRSLVGLIPLHAVQILEPEMVDRIQAPPGVVHRQPARPHPEPGLHAHPGKQRAAAAGHRGSGQAALHPAFHAG
jgi:hypothetical protein